MAELKRIQLENVEARVLLTPAVLAIVDHLRRNGTVPPIKVEEKGDGNYRIKDGRHRLAAYKLLGRTSAKAYVSTRRHPLTHSIMPKGPSDL